MWQAILHVLEAGGWALLRYFAWIIVAILVAFIATNLLRLGTGALRKFLTRQNRA